MRGPKELPLSKRYLSIPVARSIEGSLRLGTYSAQSGNLRANTKEARVLILLHELGHVIEGADGRWLLPDDGKNEGLSRANSSKIEDVCDDQIRGLGKVSNMKDLGKYKEPDQQPITLSTSENTQPEPLR